MILFHLLLNWIHVVLFPKLLFLEQIFKLFTCFSQLFDNFILFIHNFDRNISDYSELVNVFKECIWNVLFSSFWICNFVKDSAESLPPPTKLLCRFKCIFNKLFKLVFNFLGWRQICNVRVAIFSWNFNQRLSFLICGENCLNCSKCSQDHDWYGIEDSSFPILVVILH